jgi:DNA-binding PadR family transcriptional regulator
MATSRSTLHVLRALLDDPAADHYGLELMEATGLKSGTLYPILGRLEDRGWIVGRWEDVDPSEVGRAPRRYYRLTASGTAEARAVWNDALARLLPKGMTWAPS